MERGDQKQIGNARAEIATRIVRLQSEYYGKGPTKAKAYITEDVVVVVLEETFTKAERTLVERGETETIKQIRRRFQQAMADDAQATRPLPPRPSATATCEFRLGESGKW